MQIVSESEFQNICEKFIHRWVILNQTTLITELLQKGFFSYDDIQNLTTVFESSGMGECSECNHETDVDSDDICEDCFEPVGQEICQWFAVDSWIAEKLQDQGEPVLITDLGIWWGRTTYGQAISMDSVIRYIVTQVKEVESNNQY